MKRAPRRVTRWSTAILVATITWALAPQAAWSQTSVSGHSVNGLPNLGDVQGMSLAEERRLGDSIARDIYRDPDYLDDPVLGDYLQAIWRPLLGAARTRGDVPAELSDRWAWELMISRDRTVNAFALPGGYLGVHLGLLAVTETPQELASVLAHELSHISQRHIARMISRQERQAPWMLGALVLSALAAGSNANLANAALAGSTAVAAQSQLNFSRDMEREADRVGFGVLTGAGFEGEGFVTMFDKLQQASRLNDDGSFPYLRSHPLTAERMADMKGRLPLADVPATTVLRNKSAPGVPAASSSGSGLLLALPVARPLGPPGSVTLPVSELHLLMAARARVLAERNSERWRAWAQLGQAVGATPAELYAASLSAQRLGQGAQALALAQRLRAGASSATRSTSDALLLELLLAGRSGGSDKQLLATLRDQALASSERAGALQGAQAALATGLPLRASERLQAWVLEHPRDAQAWQMLSSAYLAQGQRLRAVRAEAEARTAQFDYAGAVARFKAAQAMSEADRSADSIELAIVDTRRREVEALLRESERYAREQ